MSIEKSWEEFKSNYYFKSDCNYVRIVNILFSIDSTESYPLLKIPSKLKELINKEFNCGQFTSEKFFTFPTILQNAVSLGVIKEKYNSICRPIKPQLPKRTVADSYKRIYVDTSRRNRRILFNCLYFVILPTLVYILFSSVWFLIYLLIILLPPTSLIYYLIMKLRFFEDISISGSVRLSEDEISNIQNELDKEYQSKLIFFEDAKNMYEKELFKYKMSQGQLTKAIEPYLDIILFSIQNNFSVPSMESIQIDNNPKNGALELFFYKKLLKKFPLYVKRDIKVGRYFPDIAVVINNICYIDVEIDEPYSFDEKSPIHYIGSSDVERDMFFTEAGWYVVRFSEFQIKQDCEDCVAFIENLICFLQENKASYLNNVKLIQKKIISKKWSYEEAEIMIQENWRKMYL